MQCLGIMNRIIQWFSLSLVRSLGMSNCFSSPKWCSCLILQLLAVLLRVWHQQKMSLRNALGSVRETWQGFKFFLNRHCSNFLAAFSSFCIFLFSMFIMLSVIAFLTGFVRYRSKRSIGSLFKISTFLIEKCLRVNSWEMQMLLSYKYFL